MDFVAVDFETANEKRNSPCSIGIAVVKDNVVVDKIYYLIKPEEMRFQPVNIGIHGIRPAMVENERKFNEIWPQIKHYFEENLIVAHNAAFDVSVLRSTLELYNIKVPEFKYICTMKIAKNFYSHLEDAKLSTINKFLGFKFNHHEALDDALACSNILLNVMKEMNTNKIDVVTETLGITLGYASQEGHTPCSSRGRILKTSDKIYVPEKVVHDYNIGAFNDEVVVFTGRLNTMTRSEAFSLVRKLGGDTGSSVTKRTTCLVTNSVNIKGLRREEMSTKYRRAIDLKDEGQNIEIIDEDEFLMRCSRKYTRIL